MLWSTTVDELYVRQLIFEFISFAHTFIGAGRLCVAVDRPSSFVGTLQIKAWLFLWTRIYAIAYIGIVIGTRAQRTSRCLEENFFD